MLSNVIRVWDAPNKKMTGLAATLSRSFFGRTDNPKGELYENHVNVGMNNPEMARFVEMCFDPGSAMNERLKATLVKMLSEVNEK